MLALATHDRRQTALARSLAVYKSCSTGVFKERQFLHPYLGDKSNQLCGGGVGWLLLYTVCFYESNERHCDTQGISIFAFTSACAAEADIVHTCEAGATRSDRHLHSAQQKSLLKAGGRGFTYRMQCPSSLRLPPSLVCTNFHHGRIWRGIRRGASCDVSVHDTGVAYPINANIRGKQASKNPLGFSAHSLYL